MIRALYERRFSREDVLELFRFIDWMMTLPDELDQRFDIERRRYEEAQHVPYITGIERRGILQGIQQGVLQELRESILEFLDARYEPTPDLAEKVRQISDPETLRRLRRVAFTATSLEEFRSAVDAETQA